MLKGAMQKGARPAALVLEDGTCFAGSACGAEGTVWGEICFNTSLVGYLEVISDPSYAGQIITMTYPQIGNYGVALEDLQREGLALRGLVVRDMCYTPSSFRSVTSLPSFLAEKGVVAIEGVDTRALTQHIRDKGAMRAVISTTELDTGSLREQAVSAPSIVGENLARTVSVGAPFEFEDDNAVYDSMLKPSLPARHHVVAYDCGIKRGILRALCRQGCRVTVVPWDTPARDVLALRPDGVFFSNGPGDPEPLGATYEAARQLLGAVPVFGICLGHQMLALAAGAQTEKLKFGHRGANQPVMGLRTRCVEITAQNHGFGVVFASLGRLVPDLSGSESEHTPHNADGRHWVRRSVAPVVRNERFGRIQLTHVNLNDGTPEGLAFLDIPAFCVQYHPEASPGPTDSHYLFAAFSRLMDGREDYLDIDLSADRLAEWK
ncbi:MAG: glutamine-hydrolyzing carbamoyl-phosphate synthase small subunit [Coriobacteriales bacterium]|jgi:carbamoyl-phosphate synthase small subunit|nr:glutamine-hydrolyzing carbamoyl-phosphate synthase small subunit [Coriobacteriales bacterium]